MMVCLSLCVLLIEICVAFERRWTVIKHAPISQFTKGRKYAEKEKKTLTHTFHLFRFYIYQRSFDFNLKQIGLRVYDTNRISCEPKCRFQRTKYACKCPVSTFRIITNCQARMSLSKKFRSFSFVKWGKKKKFLLLFLCLNRKDSKGPVIASAKTLCSNQESRFCVDQHFGNFQNEFALYLGVKVS